MRCVSDATSRVLFGSNFVQKDAKGKETKRNEETDYKGIKETANSGIGAL